MRQEKTAGIYAGIHLSGPSVARTSLLMLRGSFFGKSLEISDIYDKIIALGDTFTDDRLTNLIRLHTTIREIVIDVPLSVPPCVACTRATCPGVVSCEDLDVAYMLALCEKMKKQNAKRHHRQINPQTQRLWDCISSLETVDHASEPTYHANLAPIVVRAMTLKRRLAHFKETPSLKETSVPQVVRWIARRLGLGTNVWHDYKSFQGGESSRQTILNAMQKEAWIHLPEATDNTLGLITASLPLFQALMAALVAAMCHEGLCHNPFEEDHARTGWVYLPKSDPAELADNRPS